MPKYNVRIEETEIYHVEVEADNAEEAEDKAIDAIDSEEGKAKHWHDSDGGFTTVEV